MDVLNRRLRQVAGMIAACGLAAAVLSVVDGNNQNPASALLFAGGLFDLFLAGTMLVYVALMGQERRSIASPARARVFFSLFVVTSVALLLPALFLGRLLGWLYLSLVLLVVAIGLTFYWLRLVGARWNAAMP